MEITKEMIEQQAKEFTIGMDNVKQGYNMALSWVTSVIEQKEDKKE